MFVAYHEEILLRYPLAGSFYNNHKQFLVKIKHPLSNYFVLYIIPYFCLFRFLRVQ